MGRRFYTMGAWVAAAAIAGLGLAAPQSALAKRGKGKKAKAAKSAGPDLTAKAVMQLKNSTKSGDFATRAAAVAGLGKVPKKQRKEVVPMVKEALKDAQWQVRRAAIEALLNLGDKSWEKAIGDAMALRGLDPAREVLPLLEPLGVKRGVALVKKVLGTPKFDGPERYSKALGARGGEWMVASYLMGTALKGQAGDAFRNNLAALPLPDAMPVYKAVLHKQTPAIQAAVITRVAADKRLKDIDFVAKALKSKDAKVTFAAALALAHRKNAAGKSLLVAALAGDNEADKLAALTALREIPNKDLYPALQPFTRSDKTPINVLSAVLEIHAALKNPKLAPWLHKQLVSTNVDRRAVAAGVLGRVEGRGALPTLHKLLRDGNFAVRVGAANSVADLAPQESITIIRDVLFTEQDPRMKIALLRALGRIRTPACVPVIRSEISQDDPKVKAAAVRAMGAIRHESAVADLKLAFGDRSADVRKGALVAIMDLGPQRYLSFFKQALNWVTPELLDELTKKHGAQLLPHLKLALASSKEPIRKGALAATRHLDKAAQVTIAKSLAVTSQRLNQRLAGLKLGMKLMSKADAIDLATTLAKDKEKLVAVASLNALGRLGAKSARSLLEKTLDGESEAARVAAASALLGLK